MEEQMNEVDTGVGAIDTTNRDGGAREDRAYIKTTSSNEMEDFRSVGAIDTINRDEGGNNLKEATRAFFWCLPSSYHHRAIMHMRRWKGPMHWCPS